MPSQNEPPSFEWPGKSGKTYKHFIFPIETEFDHVPANYIFALKASDTRWLPAYIGETDDIAKRMPSHEKKPCALRIGATHIHAHVNTGSETDRKLEESDLIALWKPPCNVQGV